MLRYLTALVINDSKYYLDNIFTFFKLYKIVKKNNTMSQNLLSEITQFLGLSKDEAAVYENLLQQKEVNISLIATKLGLNRTQVYNIFEKLSKLGLIIKPKGRTTQVELVNPSNLLIKLKEKELTAQKYQKQIQQILPTLEQSFSQNNRAIPINLIQGKQKFEDLFLEMYDNSSKELLFIGNADDFYNFLDENYIDYAIKKRAKKGVLHRVLSFQPGISLKNLAEFEKRDLRQVRYLPAEFSSLGYLNIFDNKIVNWNTQLARAVVIEDKVMANFYKTIFEILWKLSA